MAFECCKHCDHPGYDGKKGHLGQCNFCATKTEPVKEKGWPPEEGA